MNNLIVGDANSIWIKTIISETYIPYNEKVTIATAFNETFKRYYEENNINVICRRGIILSMCFENFDVVHVHYINSRNAIKAIIYGLFSKKIILTFWGSDVLRCKNKKILVGIACRLASSLTLSTDVMIERFRALYGDKYDGKISKVPFGCAGLRYIDGIKESQVKIREKLGIDKDKVIISVGYNRQIAQNHIPVLEALLALPEKIRKGMHLIVRLTYGNGDSDYVDRIVDIINKIDCSAGIYENYLCESEMAKLTYITDIFIHAQTTDARSASVSEHLYAKCLLINPSWIEYTEYKDRVFYLEYDSFDEITGLVEKNFARKVDSQYKKECNRNTEAIRNICSWDSCSIKWRETYVGNNGK